VIIWKATFIDFGTNKDEVMRKKRRQSNEELIDLYAATNIIPLIQSRKIRWTRHIALTGDRTGAYRVLAGRNEGRRPLERPRRRWENNIKMGLRRSPVGRHGLDCFGSG
jgi:hypothetical protein